jgi:predicted metal-binding membrane protein
MLHLTHQTLDPLASRAGVAQTRFALVAWSLFAAAALATLLLCDRMAEMGGMAMPGMAMPGGWSMSMMWMRMPGQTWPGFASAFMGMWLLMMTAMMMPVLAPVLARYRRAFDAPQRSAIALSTFAVAGGYFFVWAVVGLVLFASGAAFATLAMDVDVIARSVPVMAGLVVLAAGLSQLSKWKARQLKCCFHTLEPRASRSVSFAWSDGFRLGLRCVYCCAPLTAVLVALGLMDVRVMTIVTIATALERTQRLGLRVARLTGIFAAVTGAYLLVHSSL